ncbi:hypothetical protein MRX96_050817 [Rhipicephalus microplus]
MTTTLPKQANSRCPISPGVGAVASVISQVTTQSLEDMAFDATPETPLRTPRASNERRVTTGALCPTFTVADAIVHLPAPLIQAAPTSSYDVATPAAVQKLAEEVVAASSSKQTILF